MAIIISRPRDSEMCPLGKHLSDERVCVDLSGSDVGTKKIFYPENLLYLYWNNKITSYPPINAVRRNDKEIFPAHHNIDPIIHFWLNYWKSQGVTFPEGLDPLHIKAIIAEESSFDQDAENPRSKATGLMQIMEDSLKALADTERKFGAVPDNYIKKASLEDLKDPVINVATGIRWLGHKHYLLRNEDEQDRGVRATIRAYRSKDDVGSAYAKDVLEAYDLSK